MNKGQKYDNMTRNTANDTLKFFENYDENMVFVQDLILAHEPQAIYDLGCGTGNLTGPLSSCHKVFGIDKSMEMLEQAQLKFPGLLTVNTSIEEWMQREDVMKGDLVATSFVLHSIENKANVLENFCNLINRGANILIMDYCFETSADKAIMIEMLEKRNQVELADILRNKHYLTLCDFRNWCHTNCIDLKEHKLTDWIYVLELHNRN